MRGELKQKEEEKGKEEERLNPRNNTVFILLLASLAKLNAASFSGCLSCVCLVNLPSPCTFRWGNGTGGAELANQRVGCETRANEAERDRNSLVGLLRSLLLVFL